MGNTGSLVPNSLNLVFYLPSLAGGGAERAFLNITDWLQKNKPVSISILTATTAPIAYPDELNPAINLQSFDRQHVLASGKDLSAFVARHKPDAVISTLVNANICAVLNLKILSNVKTKVIIREACSPGRMLTSKIGLKEKLAYFLARFFYRAADGVIAPSKGVAEELEDLRFVKKSVHPIPNAIDFKRIAELAEGPLNAEWNDAIFQRKLPIVVNMGRLTYQKNQTMLIHAFAKLQSVFPCQLVLLGEGGDREELEWEAEKSGFRDRIHFTGFLKNPFPLLSRCDVFALSSRFEGMPNVLLQALGCGLPVVSTDCPHGPREIIEQLPEGGWISPVDDINAFASNLYEAFHCRIPKTTIRQHAEAFDINIVGEKYWTAIRSIIS